MNNFHIFVSIILCLGSLALTNEEQERFDLATLLGLGTAGLAGQLEYGVDIIISLCFQVLGLQLQQELDFQE